MPEYEGAPMSSSTLPHVMAQPVQHRAPCADRTHDRTLTKRMLCQLS